MSFAKVLLRLRDAAAGRQTSASDAVNVSRRDLAELLRDFDRIDGEYRRLHADVEASQAAKRLGNGHDIAWRRRDGVMGIKRFMTQQCYDAQTPTMQGFYEPFYCAHCREIGATLAAQRTQHVADVQEQLLGAQDGNQSS